MPLTAKRSDEVEKAMTDASLAHHDGDIPRKSENGATAMIGADVPLDDHFRDPQDDGPSTQIEHFPWLTARLDETKPIRDMTYRARRRPWG